MYLIPLLATLMSSIFCAALPVVSRNIGHRGVAVFSITSLVIAFLSSAVIWFDLYIGGSPVWLDLFGPWFEVGTVTVSWVFYFDLLTAHMLFTVTSVSLAVHIYAVVYMRSDPHLSLFMSYLSLFTFFMLVYVCGDNLIVMLVGCEYRPNGDLFNSLFIASKITLYHTNKIQKPLKQTFLPIIELHLVNRFSFHTSGLNTYKRIGPHSKLLNDVIVGGLLGDGSLEKMGNGFRFNIQFVDKFKDVADFYQTSLYNLGCLSPLELGEPIEYTRINRPNNKPIYDVKTYTFSSFECFYKDWYYYDAFNGSKRMKKVPSDINEHLSPLALALWIMGDGCFDHGGFTFSSESFSKDHNLLLCHTLLNVYGINAHLTKRDKKEGVYRIRVNKRDVPLLYKVIKPYLKESCYYKFRGLKTS